MQPCWRASLIYNIAYCTYLAAQSKTCALPSVLMYDCHIIRYCRAAASPVTCCAGPSSFSLPPHAHNIRILLLKEGTMLQAELEHAQPALPPPSAPGLFTCHL